MNDIDISDAKDKLKKSREWALEKGIIDKKLLEKQRENDRKIAEIRGHILNRVVELEDQLNTFISVYFTGNTERTRDFYDLILSEEFFTFHQKIKLFDRIAYHKQESFAGKYDGLAAYLHKVKEIRNLVAHGHRIDPLQPRIRMLSKKKPTTIDQNFLEEFKKSFETSLFSLVELNRELIAEKKRKN